MLISALLMSHIASSCITRWQLQTENEVAELLDVETPVDLKASVQTSVQYFSLMFFHIFDT